MTLDYFAAFMLFLIFICCCMEKEKTQLLKKYTLMSLFCIAALLLEAVSYTISQLLGANGDIWRTTLSTVAVVCGYGLSYFYVRYVSILAGAKHRICLLAQKILKTTAIIATVILLVGNHFGLFFTIENGDFLPQEFFAVAFGFDIIACLTGILLTFKFRRTLNPRDITALLSMPILIFISAVMQYTSYNIMFGLFLMAAVSLFIIYLMIQADVNTQKSKQEKQLTDMNVAMMLSQIQPHFLYNALSSIRRMIKKDPEIAEEAVENFSMYLRQNLESMSRVEPIPFSYELKHVEEYLYLEKLRFGERLLVEYDIAYSEFVLPVLTLQPIVENAVKHGVLKKEEGGCVKISTRREGKFAVLTVKDNGIGFAAEDVINNERLHIGFNNVKNRIEIQCKGSVEVESDIGFGTTVTMKIPVI